MGPCQQQQHTGLWHYSCIRSRTDSSIQLSNSIKEDSSIQLNKVSSNSSKQVSNSSKQVSNSNMRVSNSSIQVSNSLLQVSSILVLSSIMKASNCFLRFPRTQHSTARLHQFWFSDTSLGISFNFEHFSMSLPSSISKLSISCFGTKEEVKKSLNLFLRHFEI